MSCYLRLKSKKLEEFIADYVTNNPSNIAKMSDGRVVFSDEKAIVSFINMVMKAKKIKPASLRAEGELRKIGILREVDEEGKRVKTIEFDETNLTPEALEYIDFRSPTSLKEDIRKQINLIARETRQKVRTKEEAASALQNIRIHLQELEAQGLLGTKEGGVSNKYLYLSNHIRQQEQDLEIESSNTKYNPNNVPFVQIAHKESGDAASENYYKIPDEEQTAEQSAELNHLIESTGRKYEVEFDNETPVYKLWKRNENGEWEIVSEHRERRGLYVPREFTGTEEFDSPRQVITGLDAFIRTRPPRVEVSRKVQEKMDKLSKAELKQRLKLKITTKVSVEANRELLEARGGVPETFESDDKRALLRQVEAGNHPEEVTQAISEQMAAFGKTKAIAKHRYTDRDVLIYFVDDDGAEILVAEPESLNYAMVDSENSRTILTADDLREELERGDLLDVRIYENGEPKIIRVKDMDASQKALLMASFEAAASLNEKISEYTPEEGESVMPFPEDIDIELGMPRILRSNVPIKVSDLKDHLVDGKPVIGRRVVKEQSIELELLNHDSRIFTQEEKLSILKYIGADDGLFVITKDPDGRVVVINAVGRIINPDEVNSPIKAHLDKIQQEFQAEADRLFRLDPRENVINDGLKKFIISKNETDWLFPFIGISKTNDATLTYRVVANDKAVTISNGTMSVKPLHVNIDFKPREGERETSIVPFEDIYEASETLSTGDIQYNFNIDFRAKSPNTDNLVVYAAPQLFTRTLYVTPVDFFKEEAPTVKEEDASIYDELGEIDFEISQLDLPTRTFEEAAINLSKILPSSIAVTRADLSRILDTLGDGERVLGFFSGSAIYLDSEVVQGTEYHEAYHAVFNLLYTQEEQETALATVTKTFSKEEIDDFRTKRRYTGKSDEWIIRKMKEEILADGFKEYQNETYEGILGWFHKKLKDFLAWIQRKDVRRQYRLIAKGTYVNREVGNPDSDVSYEVFKTGITADGYKYPTPGQVEFATNLIASRLREINILFRIPGIEIGDEEDNPIDWMTQVNKVIDQLSSTVASDLKKVWKKAGNPEHHQNLQTFLKLVGHTTNPAEMELLAANREGIIKRALAKLKALRYEYEELEDSVGPRFDLDNTMLNPEDSLNTQLKAWLSLAEFDRLVYLKDTKEHVSLPDVVNSVSIFNALLKALAGKRREDIWKTLDILGKTDDNLAKAFAFFTKEFGIVKEGDEFVVTKPSTLLDQFYSGFEVDHMEYVDVLNFGQDTHIRESAFQTYLSTKAASWEHHLKTSMSKGAVNPITIKAISDFVYGDFEESDIDYLYGHLYKFLPFSKTYFKLAANKKLRSMEKEYDEDFVKFVDPHNYIAGIDLQLIDFLGKYISAYQAAGDKTEFLRTESLYKGKFEASSRIKEAIKNNYYLEFGDSPLTIKTVEGKTRYTIARKSFLTSRLLEIADKYPQAKLYITNGYREGNRDGIQFSDFKPVHHMRQAYAAFLRRFEPPSRSSGEADWRDASPGQAVFPFIVQETTNTFALIQLPVSDVIRRNPSKAIQKSRDMALELVQLEYEDISRAAREPQTPSNVNSFIVDGKVSQTNSKGQYPRSMQFWEMKSLLTAALGESRVVELETQARNQEPFSLEISDKLKIQEELTKQLHKAVINTTELFVEPTDKNQEQALKRILKEFPAINAIYDGDIELFIIDEFMNSWVSTYKFMREYFGDLRSFKDPAIDMIKRTKSLSAAGQSLPGGKYMIIEEPTMISTDPAHAGTKIEQADGQVWGTPLQKLKNEAHLGRLNSKSIDVYAKILSGIRLTQKDRKILESQNVALESTKIVGVSATDAFDYIKCSQTWIVPADIGYFPDDVMEDVKEMQAELQAQLKLFVAGKSHSVPGTLKVLASLMKPLPSKQFEFDLYQKMVVDEIGFAIPPSASKARTIHPGQTGEFKDGSVRLQVETHSGDETVTKGTQTYEMLWGDIPSDTLETIAQKNEWRETLTQAFMSSFVQRIQELDPLIGTRLKSTILESDPDELYDNILEVVKEANISPEELSRLIQSGLASTGGSQKLIDWFSVENGEPIYLWETPHLFKQVQNKILKAFSSNVFSKKTHGAAYILVSPQAYQVAEDTNGKIVQLHDQERRLKAGEQFTTRNLRINRTIENGIEIVEYEAVVPRKWKWDFDLKPGDELPKEFYEAFGYRIPTTSAQSMTRIVIVDFLDASLGDIMILPPEAQLESGHDYDVDKQFTESISAFKYNGDWYVHDNEDYAWFSYLDYISEQRSVARAIKEAKKQAKLEGREFSRVDMSRVLHELGYPATPEEYQAAKASGLDYNIYALNNRLVRQQNQLFLHPSLSPYRTEITSIDSPVNYAEFSEKVIMPSVENLGYRVSRFSSHAPQASLAKAYKAYSMATGKGNVGIYADSKKKFANLKQSSLLVTQPTVAVFVNGEAVTFNRVGDNHNPLLDFLNEEIARRDTELAEKIGKTFSPDRKTGSSQFAAMVNLSTDNGKVDASSKLNLDPVVAGIDSVMIMLGFPEMLRYKILTHPATFEFVGAMTKSPETPVAEIFSDLSIEAGDENVVLTLDILYPTDENSGHAVNAVQRALYSLYNIGQEIFDTMTPHKLAQGLYAELYEFESLEQYSKDYNLNLVSTSKAIKKESALDGYTDHILDDSFTVALAKAAFATRTLLAKDFVILRPEVKALIDRLGNANIRPDYADIYQFVNAAILGANYGMNVFSHHTLPITDLFLKVSPHNLQAQYDVVYEAYKESPLFRYFSPRKQYGRDAKASLSVDFVSTVPPDVKEAVTQLIQDEIEKIATDPRTFSVGGYEFTGEDFIKNIFLFYFYRDGLRFTRDSFISFLPNSLFSEYTAANKAIKAGNPVPKEILDKVYSAYLLSSRPHKIKVSYKYLRNKEIEDEALVLSVEKKGKNLHASTIYGFKKNGFGLVNEEVQFPAVIQDKDGVVFATEDGKAHSVPVGGQVRYFRVATASTPFFTGFMPLSLMNILGANEIVEYKGMSTVKRKTTTKVDTKMVETETEYIEHSFSDKNKATKVLIDRGNKKLYLATPSGRTTIINNKLVYLYKVQPLTDTYFDLVDAISKGFTGPERLALETRALGKTDESIRERLFRGGEVTTIGNLLQDISKSAHPLAPLAAHLQGVSNRIKSNDVLLVDKLIGEKDGQVSELEGAAAYFPADGRIEMDYTKAYPSGDSTSAGLHEVMHALTYKEYENSPEFKAKVDALYAHAKKHSGGRDFYGLKNSDEFLAELFTNSEFITFLKSVPPTGGSYKSVWEELLSSILKAIGLEQSNSLYEEAFSVVALQLQESADISDMNFPSEDSLPTCYI